MGLLELFGVFFYIGLFTIGGGLAAIPLMQEAVVAKGLIDPELFFAMIAISESTPGPIGINMATYIGYELYGVWGGIFTTAGTVLPSLIIILIIARHYTKMMENRLVNSAFFGLRAAVTGMVAAAAWDVISIALFSRNWYSIFQEEAGVSHWQEIVNLPSVIFFVPALILVLKTKIHPILIIVAGGIFGVLFL
ncbi:MAG: chromate transporter [Spirochaetaceae bacterium]|nr:chromate transporter [Spirochaetaceae bacterium]